MTITGTHGYRAPEVYERARTCARDHGPAACRGSCAPHAVGRRVGTGAYGKPSDWWNVGLLIYEMLMAENPLRGDSRKESEYLTKCADGQPPPPPDSASSWPVASSTASATATVATISLWPSPPPPPWCSPHIPMAPSPPHGSPPTPPHPRQQLRARRVS